MEIELRKEEVEILNHIYSDQNITQRRLADSLDVSLGMVNLFIKKLSEKGLIKVKKLKNRQMLQYVLTPQGFKDRLKHNYSLLKGSIDYFISIREIILDRLQEINAGTRNIYIFGTDIWAEMIFLGVRHYGFMFSGFIRDQEAVTEKMGYPVHDQASAATLTDSIVIINSAYREQYLNEPFLTGINGNVIWL